jgi:hypothetical protein
MGIDMSMGEYSIQKIDKQTAELFVLQQHYSHRASIFWAGFALVKDNLIEGVVVYGQPSPPIQRHAFTDRKFRLYELSRLVIQTEDRNAASVLIAGSLKLLEKPCAVISYADMEMNHCGIVYQATNWIYTGPTVSHDHAYMIDGKRVHPISLRDKGITNPKEWARINGVQTVKPMEKHRYFFLCGSKTQRASMLKTLRYPVVKQYPKCDQARYDTGDKILTNHGD